MAFSIPTSDWKEAQEIAKGKEFKPSFDYIDPKKPYVLSFYEWLSIKGNLVKNDLNVTNTSTTLYTVPDNKTLFLISYGIEGVSQGLADTYGFIYINNNSTGTANNKIIYLHMRDAGAAGDIHATEVANPVTPVRIDSGAVLGARGAGANAEYTFWYIGYEVDNYFLKEN